MSNKFKSFEALQEHLIETGEVVVTPSHNSENGVKSLDLKAGKKKNKGRKSASSSNKKQTMVRKQSKRMRETVEKAVKTGKVNVVFKHDVKPLPGEHNEDVYQINSCAKEKSPNNTYRESSKDRNNLNEITYVDVLCIGGPNKCIKDNHKMEDLQAIVSIISRLGNEKSIYFNATYCFDCNKYFMEDWQYDLLIEKGIPQCRVSFDKHSKHNEETSGYDKLSAESLIHQYGYNVQEKNGLTDVQRQTLLMYLMENKIVKSKMEITTHLTWLINQKQRNSSMENAVAKWKADREFVNKYKLGTYKVVVVRSIKK